MTKNAKPQQRIAEFWKRIDADQAFRQQFFKSVPEQAPSGAPIVEFAARHGYVFTEQELRDAAAKVAGGGELSGTQLEGVAGGIMGPSIRPSSRILLRFASTPFRSEP